MKRLITLFLVVVMMVSSVCVLTGCEEPEPITCEIRFAKSVDDRYEAAEWFDGTEFEVNTKIYVIVKFTLMNTHDSEYATINLNVELPHAEYYSTHEYRKGPIVPDEEIIPNAGGYNVIRLTGMQFSIKPGSVAFNYTYCFEIKASTVCDDATFKVVFSSSLENEKDGVMNQNYPFTQTYSFVQSAGGEN